MYSLTNLVKSLFEKAKKIRYNENDLSLFDDFGKPAEYGKDFTPRPRIPGQERPNHKYIERKPDPKNPGKYIYIYELPDGTRYEESGPEPEVTAPAAPDKDFSKHRKPDTPSLFDQPAEEPAKDFIHIPEGEFTPAKAREFAEKNKDLIGDGILSRILNTDGIGEDMYNNIVEMVQMAAKGSDNTIMSYEEFTKKAAAYDRAKIDPDNELKLSFDKDTYLPVSGKMSLKRLNQLQIEYDKKHPAAPKPLVDTTPEPGEKKDLDTQVQELLDAKQKNKQFKDLNERVSGSRKEAAAIKKLQAEEILKLDNATQYERINKKLAMPEYDPHAAKEAGVKAGVVYMNMKIRDSIAAKPVNNATARQIYVKFMPALLEELENAPNLDDMKGVFRKYFDDLLSGYGGRMKRQVLFTQGAMDKFKELGIELETDDLNQLMVQPEAVLGKIFCGLVGQTTDTAKDHWRYAEKVSGITNHEIQQKKQEWIKRLKDGYEAAYNASDEKVDKMGPHELGNELRKYKVVTDDKLDMDKWSIKFWKQDFSEDELNQIMDELKRKRRAQIMQEMEDDKAIEAKAEKIAKQDGESRPNNWEFLPAKEEAADGTVPEAKIDKKKVSDTIKQFPKLLKIIRTNGREVTDAEVTVENLHDLFGYKSVQLGNWVKDHEAKEHIKHFIASMKDMEDALGIDLKKMNETAGLSIAFGARGRSNSLAHYEPMRKIINLTKTKGDGTIAHEWGHFFDHYLGGAEGDKLEEEGYASVKKAVHFEIREIVDELVKEIKTGRVMKTETFQPPEVTPKAQYRVFNFVMNSSRIPDEERESRLIDEARTLMQRYPEKEREIGELAAYAAKKPLKIEFEGLNHFYSNSMKQKNKKYWANNQELFARSWEAYVEDKLAENGLYNNYLVSGNKIGTGDRSNEAFSVYPQGEFRGRLNKIFDRLMETTKKVYGVGKDRDTETPRVNEMIDYTSHEGDNNLFAKAIVTPAGRHTTTTGRSLMKALRNLLQKARGRNIKYTSDDYAIEFPMDFTDLGENLFTGMVKDGKILEPAHSNPNVRRYHRKDEPVKPEEVQKEAAEHPGTFDKIQSGEIKTPEDLGEAIAKDHQSKEETKWDLTDEPSFTAAELVVDDSGKLTIVAHYDEEKGGVNGSLRIARIPYEYAEYDETLHPASVKKLSNTLGTKTFIIPGDGIYSYNNYRNHKYAETVYFTVENGKVAQGQHWNGIQPEPVQQKRKRANPIDKAKKKLADAAANKQQEQKVTPKLPTSKDPMLREVAEHDSFIEGYNKESKGTLKDYLQKLETGNQILEDYLNGFGPHTSIPDELYSTLGELNKVIDKVNDDIFGYGYMDLKIDQSGDYDDLKNGLTGLNYMVTQVERGKIKPDTATGEPQVKQEAEKPRKERKRPEVENNTFGRMYNALESILQIPLHQLKPGDHFKLKSEGYMDLNFDTIDEVDDGLIHASLAHYYKQDGDLMKDPEMEILIDQNNGTVQALSFEQDGFGGEYQVVYPNFPDMDQFYSIRKKNLNSFLTDWLKRLKGQGHTQVIEPEIITSMATGTGSLFDETPAPTPTPAPPVPMKPLDPVLKQISKDPDFKYSYNFDPAAWAAQNNTTVWEKTPEDWLDNLEESESRYADLFEILEGKIHETKLNNLGEMNRAKDEFLRNPGKYTGQDSEMMKEFTQRLEKHNKDFAELYSELKKKKPTNNEDYPGYEDPDEVMVITNPLDLANLRSRTAGNIVMEKVNPHENSLRQMREARLLKRTSPQNDYIVYRSKREGQKNGSFTQIRDEYVVLRVNEANRYKKSFGKSLFKSVEGILHQKPQAGTVKDGKILEPSFKNPSVMRYHSQGQQTAGPEPSPKEEDRTPEGDETERKFQAVIPNDLKADYEKAKQEGKEVVAHATTTGGVAAIVDEESRKYGGGWKDYLSTSSIGCPTYADKGYSTVYLAVTGEVDAYNSGDIGRHGLQAKQTGYDEIELKNFEPTSFLIPRDETRQVTDYDEYLLKLVLTNRVLDYNYNHSLAVVSEDNIPSSEVRSLMWKIDDQVDEYLSEDEDDEVAEWVGRGYIPDGLEKMVRENVQADKKYRELLQAHKQPDPTPEPPKENPADKLKKKLEAIRHYSKVVQPVIADYIKQSLFTQGGYGIMNQTGTRVDTIGRDTRDPSRWKIATFINGEASTDMEYTDIDTAIKEFISDAKNSFGAIGSEEMNRFYNEAKEALSNKVPQTETRAFKDWFKGSKVTDDTGKPLKVFHGTAGDFNKFQYSQDLGFHFGTAEQASLLAEDHGDNGAVMPVYLRIENPLELPDIGFWYQPKAVTHILEKTGVISSSEVKQIEKIKDASDRLKKIKALLTSKGYDGIKYENTVEGAGTSYIAFNANQIKSAIGNTGEFSRYSDDITKSVDTKQYPTYGEIEFQGLKIVVENKPGTVRRGTDPDGEKWKTKMFYPYGYIKGTKGSDGEAIDVYVGKNRDSQKVFIVHQKDIETKKYDEDKVMLGFDTKESARDAYLAHYDSYEFLGEITEMSIEELKQKIKTRKGNILKSQMKWRVK